MLYVYLVLFSCSSVIYPPFYDKGTLYFVFVHIANFFPVPIAVFLYLPFTLSLPPIYHHSCPVFVWNPWYHYVICDIVAHYTDMYIIPAVRISS